MESNGRGIPGGVGMSYPGMREGVTFYVETPDITASLAHVESLGGRIVMPRTVLPGMTLTADAANCVRAVGPSGRRLSAIVNSTRRLLNSFCRI
jgi:predicted enzyme related to lactoylglutathione lyase